MDAGNILARSETPILELETAGELHDRLAVAGAGLLADTLRDLEAGRIVETPQDPTMATLARKLSRESAMIDFARPAEAVARQIRGLFPWPGCRVQLVDEQRKIRAKLTLVRAVSVAGQGLPGVLVDGGQVGCGEGRLRVLEVLPDGKRVMSLDAFRNGHPWEPGMRLEGIA